MTTAILDELEQLDLPLADIWLSGARFHIRTLGPHFEALPPGNRVLEIGCGAGVLMALLQQKNPDIQIDGIEPFGSGFASIETFRAAMARHKLNIAKVGYEDFFPDAPYDLVYMVNVLEHLPDWRHFFDVLPRFVRPGGRVILLFPNAGFPFEPHFQLPIVGPKRLLRWLFARRIERIERDYNTHGLWDSLNLVRIGQIRSYVRGRPLRLTFHSDTADRMIDRFDTDPVFMKYIGVIAPLARFFKRSGATRLLRYPVFAGLNPYAFVEIEVLAPDQSAPSSTP